MANDDKAEIERAFNWFLGFLDPRDWSARKDAIEDHMESVVKRRASQEGARISEPVSVNRDRMGWYLYLVETALNRLTHYEPIQGSRVLPIFQRLGSDFEHLRQIGAIDEKAKRLVTVESDNPDSGLFEILVALLWKKNGWSEVEFVPEAPPEKRPDICAKSGGVEWAIECKRLAKSSGYSLTEREKWLRMWQHFSTFLIERRMPIVLDIIFHVELESLPDEFLRDELVGKLPLVLPPCRMISNEIWEVEVSNVDLAAAARHLCKNYVKYPSDQVNELVAGVRDPNRGFTSIVSGRQIRLGEGRGHNRFIDTMDFAAGAFWHCDNQRAIERKARDIRTRLAEAVRQLPDNTPSVVHIGLETLDGVLVEAERYQRIFNTVRHFDPHGKDLKWVYCHLYQAYAPPDQAWVFDETVYYFGHSSFAKDQPLSFTSTVVPKEDSTGSGVHWLKDPP